MKKKYNTALLLNFISQDLCEHATLRIIAKMLRLRSVTYQRDLLSMYLTCLQIFNIIGRQTISKKANLTLLLSYVEGDKRVRVVGR